jgi:thioredoxin 1
MIIIYIISGIILLLISLQLSVQIKARLKKGKVVTGLSGNIGEIVRRGERVMMYFYSPTCAACRYQTPIIDDIQRTKKNIFKIDISKDYKTAMAVGVMGTPSTVIIKGGVINKIFVGAKQKKTLLESMN